MNNQKLKNYSSLKFTIKRNIRKLTWGKIGVDKVENNGNKGLMYDFNIKPRAFRKTHGFNCLWIMYETGFIYLSFIYKGKKKWYDVLKMLIPSKRRELKQRIGGGISIPSSLAPQRRCKEYNELAKKLEADVNPQQSTVNLSLAKYISNKQELEEAIKTAMTTLCDEETKGFIQTLGV